MYSNEWRRRRGRRNHGNNIETTTSAVVKIQAANECLSIWLHNKYSFNCLPRPTLIERLVWFSPCICVFQFRFAAMISEFDESAPHSVSSVRFVVFHVLYRVARKYTFAKLPIYSHILISFLPFNSFDLFLALAPTVSSLIFPFTEYIECSVVRSSGRRLFMLQQIDLPILGMKSKLVNNEIVTQATNSMCKVTI